MTETVKSEGSQGGPSRGHAGLGVLNTILILICTLLGSIVAGIGLKDGVIKSETEYVDKILSDARLVNTNDALAKDQLASLNMRAARRGCDGHLVLKFLYADFKREMVTVCYSNDLAIRILSNIDADLTKKAQGKPHAAIQEAPATVALASRPAGVEVRSNSPYKLDIFWCESVDRIASEDIANQQTAKRIFDTVKRGDLFQRLRIRKLASSRIDSFYSDYYGRGVVAGADPEDIALLNVVRERVRVGGVNMQIMPWEGVHDNYLSIFVCNNARTLDRSSVPEGAPSAAPAHGVLTTDLPPPPVK